MKNTTTVKNTQERIKEAFWALYSKKEIWKISTTEIAQLACIHRNTFYRYYSSVYALRDSEEQQLIDVLVPYANEQMVDNRNYVIEVFQNILEQNDEKYRLAVIRNAAGFSESYKIILFPILQKIFNGEKGPKMDDYMIDYILSGSIALIVRCFKNTNENPPVDLASTIIEFLTGYMGDDMRHRDRSLDSRRPSKLNSQAIMPLFLQIVYTS